MNPQQKAATPVADGPLRTALADRSVVLCLGSGGVGKTTTSAALALALAKGGERVVVLTIDPARRLADALGLGGELGNEAVKLTLPKPSRAADRINGEVWAAMLDPAETFEQIIRAEAGSRKQAERVLANRLFKNLTSSLSGTNEYMAAERLHQLHNDDRFDRVIVDTPPSRHAIDFLDSPGRLTRFVEHRLYRSVFAPKRSLLRPLNAGSQIIMRLLARLVGSSLVDDVISLFSDFEGMDKGFQRRASEVDALLRGPETAAILVAAPRRDRLAEASWIAGNLAARDRAVDAIVINRSLPLDAAEAGAAMDEVSGPLAENLAELLLLAAQEDELVTELLADVGAAPLIRVAEQAKPIRDLRGLAGLARELG
ncbi:MAG: ArsA-related P-loop ATPase [Actinomycetota bacterium]